MPNNRITLSNGTGRKSSNVSDITQNNPSQAGVSGFQDPPELALDGPIERSFQTKSTSLEASPMQSFNKLNMSNHQANKSQN
jgi:hypothetical protein